VTTDRLMLDVLSSTTTRHGELCVVIPLTTKTHKSPAACSALSTVYFYFILLAGFCAIEHILNGVVLLQKSSSSLMRFMSHNWAATKQRLHSQSVAEISRHSVLSGDRIRQCETSSGSRHKDTDHCL